MTQIKTFQDFSLTKIERECNEFLTGDGIKFMKIEHSSFKNFSGASIMVLTLVYEKTRYEYGSTDQGRV